MIIFQLIIFILFIALLMVLGFVFRVLSLFRRPRFGNPFGAAGDGSRQQEYAESDSPTRRKKIFSDTDGEYVDFEEIKK